MHPGQEILTAKISLYKALRVETEPFRDGVARSPAIEKDDKCHIAKCSEQRVSEEEGSSQVRDHFRFNYFAITFSVV